LVETFSALGARVTFQYFTNRELALSLASKHSATPVSLDFSKPYAIPKEQFDILINNGGVNISSAQTVDVPDADYELTLSINLNAPLHLIQSYLPQMIKNRWGRIINISSIYGVSGSTNNLPYNISKHGLSAVTKTVAKEYAQFGITCNEICPGPIESELMQRIANNKAKLSGKSPEEFFETLRSNIPARRLAFPQDISHCAVFLASEYASYINGTSIIIDGGLIC
jgi:NAD(P)-dependent dehydrogenase (short-subunit alcohol dehydrogenase family)